MFRALKPQLFVHPPLYTIEFRSNPCVFLSAKAARSRSYVISSLCVTTPDTWFLMKRTGTFGRVDLAWSEPTKQHYAVKKFNVHDVRVTEFVEGGELRDYLSDMSRAHATCSLREDLYDAVRFYSMEIIVALQHIHSKNIVLRDLKPENLLLSEDGHVKIADFGLAKVLKGKTYTICGTPEFMAPELISRKGYGMDVDWWSLGVLLFELITGRTPFSGDTQEDTFEAIQKGDLQFPDGFHAAAREVVEKLLDRNPCNRAPNKSMLAWYAAIDWGDVEGLKIAPPFKPAPFEISELRPLEESEEVASSQRERDLFADWCEIRSD
ncbi:kinase domain protein [Ancylostoma duodenale]|uniref:Kinase domain protein n=1 Tax=Ancylostoma duodenale TaxID=51022 RepID=A0A0C2H5Y3_9BILA|nr:kinase domain protein [Ancylostoma duodenale]